MSVIIIVVQITYYSISTLCTSSTLLIAEIDLMALSNSLAECTAKSIEDTAMRSMVSVASLLIATCVLYLLHNLKRNFATLFIIE